MARGVNRVTLLGNLGADPSVSLVSATGAAIAHLSVATSSAYKDKKTGEKKETTEWHRVVFFNRLAEVARDYLRKGSKIYCEGSLRTRKWKDKEGIDRYTTEIIGRELQMLDGKKAEQVSEEENPYLKKYDQKEETQENFQDDIPF